MFLPTRYLLVVGTFCLSVLLYVDRACIATAKDAVVQGKRKCRSAQSLTQSSKKVLAEGKTLTADLGGKASTTDVTQALLLQLPHCVYATSRETAAVRSCGACPADSIVPIRIDEA